MLALLVSVRVIWLFVILIFSHENARTVSSKNDIELKQGGTVYSSAASGTWTTT